MPNNDERRERLSDLAKAALGVGVAATFFTKTDLGKEIATTGVARMRNAFIKASEELRGESLKSMYGHGAKDIKRAVDGFKSGFNDLKDAAPKLPMRQNNFVSALAKRREIISNPESFKTKIFNQERLPEILRNAIEDIMPSTDEVGKRRVYEIADDLTTRYSKNVAIKHAENDYDIPIFTNRFNQKLNKYYGDKADQVREALMFNLSSVNAHKERYSPYGDSVTNNIQEQLNQFETYQKRFSENSFWNKLVGQQAATVEDVLKHRDQFKGQKIGDTSIVDLLDEMVQIDERFKTLIIDPSLKISGDKFYDYSALNQTLDELEERFLNGAGRILKPLEVQRHIRNTPDFFYLNKGALDDQLKAILEKNSDDPTLEHSYLRLFDKTYRVNASGDLQHMPELDDTYLTPSKKFEGQQLRHISGNVDFNLDDVADYSDQDPFDQYVHSLKQKMGMTGKVSQNYTRKTKRLLNRNKFLSHLGLGSEINLSSDYDEIITGLSQGELSTFEHIRRLIGDMDASEDAYLPSKATLKKMSKAGLTPSTKDKINLLLQDDQSVLDYLGALDVTKADSDIAILAKTYQKNPIEALGRTYYHGKQKNNFVEEARREIFKSAVYHSDAQNGLGHFMGEINSLGLPNKDISRIKNLTYTSYLQRATGMSLKNPDAILSTNTDMVMDRLTRLFMSDENKDMQNVLKQVSEDNMIKHIAKTYEEKFLEDHVSVAYRPSPYVHMRKGINVLDIIEEANQNIYKGIEKAFEFGKQFVAGRSNLEDVTNYTLYPYFGLFRLQNDVKKAGLNLSRDYTGSAFDLMKGIFSKRAMPIYGAAFALSYLNYESENFFGQSLTNMAAEATAKIDLGIRKVIDTLGLSDNLKDAYYWFSPLNYLQEEPYQTAEERKEFYESGMSPVKQSKFWTLGSSEFFGGRVLYYEPNFVKRTQVNWRDIGVYGSSEEKWKHSLIPTPRHPLSTIRYLTNPYWLEEKHKYDRPYMVSGPMFDPNTPWGTIGNLTIGNLIKPQKRLNQEFITGSGVDVRQIIEEENMRLKDEARSKNTIVIKSSDTAIEDVTPVAGSGGGYGIRASGVNQVGSGGGGISGYIARQDSIANQLNLADKIQIFAVSVKGGRDRILNQIERMNYAIKERSKWSYGNDTQYANDIRATRLQTDATLIRDKQVATDLRNLTSNQDMLYDLQYSIGELSGIYSFLSETILPKTKRYAYARSSDMYATSNRFWDSGIDGAEYKGIMEIVRRFIPHEDRNRIRVNPLRNNMPSWLPAHFKVGDPYTQIKKGEMRLPGKAYEALYGLEDKSSFMINSDFVGLDADSIINQTIATNNPELDIVSEYQQALLQSGAAIAVNKGVYDKQNNVSGTYDALIYDSTSSSGKAVMQIKAVDEATYNAIINEGAKRQDLANVNYYLGRENLDKGYVTYINKRTKAMTTYDVNFSQMVYQASQEAVRDARKTLTERVAKGVLSPYELYDDMTRFKILADVAPGSAEYKAYRKRVQANLATEQDKKEYEATLSRVERQSQKHRFFNYKFVGVKTNRQKGVIESIRGDNIKLVGDDTTYHLAGLKNYNEKIYNYLAPGMKVQIEFEKQYRQSQSVQAAFYTNGLNVNRQMMREGDAQRNDDGSAMATRALLTKNQILLGAPFEILSHLPIPIIHNKFLRMDTPYESWMRENIYGTKFSSWNRPIDTILKPAFQQAWGSSLLQGILGAGLFALNEYAKDIPDLTRGQKNIIRYAHTLFTPGAFAGEVAERVLTLNPTKASTGIGANIGAIIGLSGMALANAQNPLIALPTSAGAGALIGEWLQKGKGKQGAVIGAITGFAISAYKSKGFKWSEMGSEYIPEDVQKRWEIEEYFDRLEYLKYKGLYEKASRLALSEEGVPIDKIISELEKKEGDTEKALKRLNIAKDNVARSDINDSTKYNLLRKISSAIQSYANPEIEVPATPYVRLALGYRQAMQSTVYGLDENSSWAQTLRALEPYEREYFLEFAKETNPRKQKKILKSISPYKQKILQNAWGLKANKQKSNEKFFRSHKLPNLFWKGWNADTNLEAYKVKTIMNEGMVLSDFGYYDSEKDKPEVRLATPLQFDEENALLMRTNLISVMNGLGITDSEVSILPSQQSGIQTILDIATINMQKYKNVLSSISEQFF